jgi:hypothetical protein
MPSLRYEEVEATEKDVRELREAFEKAPPEKRIGLFYAVNHYSRLGRYRAQGFHLNYLSGTNAHHCTCGLVIFEGSGKEAKIVSLPMSSSLRLDSVQAYFGHKKLPRGEGISVGFIIDHKFSRELREDLFQGFCQACGQHTSFINWSSAIDFCNRHDESCRLEVI